jgi:hypothetical protein
METIVVNLSGTVRRETLNGRSYLVAPMTLLVPGVLEGSQGPLYYPPEEVAHNFDAWNGMPLIKGHPASTDGKPLSARTPAVLASSMMGYALNVGISSTNELQGEAWFDEDLTKRVDSNLHIALLQDRPIELSTGLFTTNIPAALNASYSGTDRYGRPYTRPYSYVARNYRPDHVAILTDQKGACSLDDGCGVNNVTTPATNALPNQPKSKVTGQFKAPNAGTGSGAAHLAAQQGALTLTEADHELGAIALKEATLGDKPSWASDASKWLRAIKAADEGGYTGDAYWATVSHIYRSMGGTVSKPPTANELSPSTEPEEASMKLTAPQRQAIITNLTTNCDCWKQQGDADVLQNFSDEKLAVLNETLQQSQLQTLALNSARETLLIDEGVALNELPEAFKKKGKKPMKGKKYIKEDGEEEEIEVTSNIAPQRPPQLSMQDWLKSAPPEAQAVWNNVVKIERDERQRHVAALTANCQNEQIRQSAAKVYGAMSLEQLRPLVAAQVQNVEQTSLLTAPFPGAIGQQPAPSYGGLMNPLAPVYLGQGATTNQMVPSHTPVENAQGFIDDDNAILEMPTVNFSPDEDDEEEAPRSRRRQAN